jgi:hypothetical protein
MRLLKISSIILVFFYTLFVSYLIKDTASQEPNKTEDSSSFKKKPELNSTDSVLQISEERGSYLKKDVVRIVGKKRNTHGTRGSGIDKRVTARTMAKEALGMPG